MSLALERFVCTDTSGRITGFKYKVEVLNEITGVLAPLFSDRAGTVRKSNPFYTGTDGVAEFYTRGGAYQITTTAPPPDGTVIVSRYRGIGTARERDNSGFLSSAGGSVGDINLFGQLAVIAAATMFVLRHTDNDTANHTIRQILSGSGSGIAALESIVGDGSNAVAEFRRYLGSQEVRRLTATLAKSFVDLGIGDNILVASAGYTDLSEISAPSNPASDKIRAYCRDIGGLSRLCYKDSVGTETQVTTPGGIWEEVGNTTVGGSVAQVDFNLPKAYQALRITCFDASFATTAATVLRVRTSPDGGSTFSLSGGLTGRLKATTFSSSAGSGTFAALANQSVNFAASTADLCGIVEIWNTDRSGTSSPDNDMTWRSRGASLTENCHHWGVGPYQPLGIVNFLRIDSPTGTNIDGGTFTVYGLTQ